MRNCAFIIPALNPKESLVEYVDLLLANGAKQIIVVNDGSKEELKSIFSRINQKEKCTVITHEVNRGKGRALKTAFSYFLNHFTELEGVVTVDADGQQAIDDVCAVANTLENIKYGIILGVRNFHEMNVPARSLIGNKFTSFIFKFLYGYNLKDTQTGLRGILKKDLEWIVNLKGERYEYEINMLVYAKKVNLEFVEVPIQTLYFDNNEGSYYHPIFDSVRVFIKLISGFIHYSFSTVTSGFIDILGFILLSSIFFISFPLNARVFYATLVARVISSTYNFYINRHFVFKGKNAVSLSLLKYYFLCSFLIIASYLLVISVHSLLNINVVIAKVCIDTILGILSYQVQLHWVFHKDRKNLKQMVGEYK